MILAKIGERGNLADERAARRAEVLRHRRIAYALVDTRDANQCRVCGRHVRPDGGFLDTREHHHIRGRGRPDSETTGNICLVCSACHRLLNDKWLRVLGNADEALTLQRRLGPDEWEDVDTPVRLDTETAEA